MHVNEWPQVSDVAGLYLAGIVESVASRLRIPKHGLSQMQLEHRSARIAKSVGMSVGVTIGCILGLFPLAWPADYRLWPAPDDAAN
jgi:tRNA-specific adenosine deaminase 1